MLLAEALMERAELKTKISQIKARIEKNAKIQEGEEVAENPEKLLFLLDKTLADYEKFIRKINYTNTVTVLPDGNTLMSILAQRDTATIYLKALRSLIEEAGNRFDRYSKSEIRIISTVDIAKVQKEADRKARELRELDMKIQKINWSTELIE